MPNKARKNEKQPYVIIGSGDLVSHLHRDPAGEGYEYRIAVHRMLDSGGVSLSLRAEDLRSVVKLCQVLAFTIADDGWSSRDERTQLFALADDLDYITHQWSEESDGRDTTS